MSNTHHSSYSSILSFGNQHTSQSFSSAINNPNHSTTVDNNQDTEWKLVTQGSKSQKSDDVISFKESPKKKSVLTQNKYFVPTKLEKSLHHNSGISAHFSSVNQPKDYQNKSNNLRCYKRNQRRNRKRAQLRAEKEAKQKEEAITLDKEIIEKNAAGISGESKPSTTLDVQDIWTDVILTFLTPKDVIRFGCCSKEAKRLSEVGHLWKSFYLMKFPSSGLSPVSQDEWKLAYKLSTNKALHKLRCFHTKKTFLEDVVGVGVDFTINPKTEKVDYISTSQDLFSSTSFYDKKIKMDVFGDEYKLFLPLYFSEEHFKRSLPNIRKTVVRLSSQKSTVFNPSMILEVFPKIVNTFVVLVSDEGLAASRKSFEGLMRIHRLFIALAHEYPVIQDEALSKLQSFASREEKRLKSVCPSLGNLIPLLMIVDQKTYQWAHLSKAYLDESLDRGVLWACKQHPKLENLNDSCPDERLKLTREGLQVGMRLNMLSVYFLWIFSKGSTHDRAFFYDQYNGSMGAEEIPNETQKVPSMKKEEDAPNKSTSKTSSPDISFQRFRFNVHKILSVKSWQEYFKYLHLPCPPSKVAMAQLLKNAVKNSLRKRYHKKGMNFTAIHASGTSKILAKGQKYSASSELQRVVFQDHWTFDSTMYLDASCLLYSGKRLVSTVDYSNRSFQQGAVDHSGDVMTTNDGTHTINIDLQALDMTITCCVFVLSAFSQATLVDVKSASVSFRDADSPPDSAPLCVYHLESHDKVPHLKSIIMCKLYRTSTDKGWHVLSIGDSHKGSADNYGPIYDAVQKLV